MQYESDYQTTYGLGPHCCKPLTIVSSNVLSKLNLHHAEYFYVQHSSNFYPNLQARIIVTCRVENGLNPGSHKPSDLDLHCFQKRIYLCSA